MAKERLLVRERTVVTDLKEKGTWRFRICLVYRCVQEIKTEHLGAFSYSASLEESALYGKVCVGPKHGLVSVSRKWCIPVVAGHLQRPCLSPCQSSI